MCNDETSSTNDDTSSEDESDCDPVHATAQAVPAMDEIHRTEEPRTHRLSSPIPAGSSLFPWDYEYSSDGDAQHTRKSYALSKCQVLTLSDRWSRTDLREHSHDILHNGKAHQLLPAVTTLRILPPPDSTNNIENDGITALCEQEGHCRFVRELSPRKIVHRNLGDAVEELQWEKAVDELVLFLPFAGWTHPTDYPEYSTEYGIACSRTKASTIVLGPGIKKGRRTRRPVPGYSEWRQSPGYETLENLVELFRVAAYRCESLTIYGLERVKVKRDDVTDHDQTDLAPQREWRWYDRCHKKSSYGPQELSELVEDHLKPTHDSSKASEYRSSKPFNIEFRTIEEYVAKQPDDELFPCELQLGHGSGTVNERWLCSNYWKSRSLCFESEPIPDLGEGDYHESDTDEETSVRVRSRYQSPYDPWKGLTDAEVREAWKREDEEEEAWRSDHPSPTASEVNLRWRRENGYEPW